MSNNGTYDGMQCLLSPHVYSLPCTVAELPRTVVLPTTSHMQKSGPPVAKRFQLHRNNAHGLSVSHACSICSQVPLTDICDKPEVARCCEAYAEGDIGERCPLLLGLIGREEGKVQPRLVHGIQLRQKRPLLLHLFVSTPTSSLLLLLLLWPVPAT